ncbi:pectate lyase family protein [Aurantiacibacter flavus]|uniref:Pectate lyase n=1 Tax=Aurantiacibacter flavus TaxID=3145232 RepID=A0ABV0D296_9SPHN
MHQILQFGAVAACGAMAVIAVISSHDDEPTAVGSMMAVAVDASDGESERSIAFPGAVGYGRFATGWRGGEVYYVTTLDDDGPGSLRDCVEHDGEGRVCVFGISGTIVVDSQIRVASNTYIAGQTAPGEGVQIRLGQGQNSPLMIFEANNVLVRDFKFRPGPSPLPSSNVDGLSIESSSNVYVDRVSVQFATDENLNVGTEDEPSEDITIARSISALSLDKSNHPKGRHSKGALLCPNDGPSEQCGRLTLYGNLFAHNRDRNPDISASPSGPIDLVNNVFYDATSQFGEFRNHYGNTWISYVGNVILPGRSTRDRSPPAAIEVFPVGEDRGFSIEVFEQDNIHLASRVDMLCDRSVSRKIVDDAAVPYIVSQPHRPLSVAPMTSDKVLEAVLAGVGARHGPDRQLDALDAAIIENVRTCGGRRINDPVDVGGWPDLPVVRGPLDSDQDGMPDEWEEAHEGLDPNDPSDAWQDRDDDGWSNLEEYLSHLAGDPLP